jgi:hypothetical protein
MADWRQIQGRIRRARTSADPAGKLNELFQKTRDAMVAFEAGAVEEKSGRSDEAVRWYTIAAQRFRRADWRQKAAEALTRLGAPVPEANSPSVPAPAKAAETGNIEDEIGDAETVPAVPDFNDAESDSSSTGNVSEGQPTHMPSSSAANRSTADRPRRRRGRRGGRRHRRGEARNSPVAGKAQPQAPARRQQTSSPSSESADEQTTSTEATSAPESLTSAAARFVPEPTGPFVERATYIRAGDPALASRFAQLESLLRRLISAPLRRVDEMEDAPAGPGVFLLSDSDLMTNYYIEACQTLRVGVTQLARSGRAGRGARTEGKPGLRSQLAEHLEISDTQVSDYLKKHCVVRWLQLDENASHLAHFAIALLRPALNAE